MRLFPNIFLVFLIINSGLFVSAQSPVAQFEFSKSEYCQEESIEISNTSLNSTAYSWDFCPLDIGSTEVVKENLVAIGGSVTGFKIVKDLGNYYGFAVASNNSLYRIEFGNSLENTPTVIEIGDMGWLVSPEGLDIQKEGSEWIGVVGHSVNGTAGYIVRLVWNNLSQSPIADSLTNFNIGGRMRDVQLIEKDGIKYILATNANRSGIIRAELGNSFKNDIDLLKVYNTENLVNVSVPLTSWTIETNSGWKTILASFTTKTISVFDFGNDLSLDPTEVKMQTFSTLGNLEKIRVVEQLGNYYAVLSSQGTGDVLIDLKRLESSDLFEDVGYTTLPDNYGHDIVKDSGRYISVGARTNLNLTKFEQSCEASLSYSEDFEPELSYNTSGEYPIELVALDDNGNSDIAADTISVTTDTAPTGTILSNDSYCISTTVNFSLSTSATITNYNWNFGDGNSSTDATPSYSYATSGTYEVVLMIQNDAGCENVLTKSIEILAEPVASYTTSGTDYCTFEDIVFTNTTTDNYGENVSWSWDFNGEGISNEKNPTFAFTASGSKTVALTVNVLGCVDTYQTIINLIEGPSVDFNYTNFCLDSLVSFTNLSTGDNIIGQTWDFGTGDLSTEPNPTFSYNTPGEYIVSLTVDNASGCSNINRDTVSIFDQIITGIIVGELTENIPFTPQVIIDPEFEGSIVSYEWEVNGQSLIDETPSYTLPEGTYSLIATVRTDQNCGFTQAQSITVSSALAPTTQFEFSKSEYCQEEKIDISNTSLNSTAYSWDFCPLDIGSTEVVTENLVSIGGSVTGFKVVKDSDAFFGFAVATNNNLYRLEFGNSLENEPEIVEIGDLGWLVSPEGIDIKQEGTEWVGIVGHSVNGTAGYLVRLVWSDLSIAPVADSLTNFNIGGRIRDVQLIEKEDVKYVLATNANRSGIVRAELGTSFKNEVELSKVYNTESLSNVSVPLSSWTVQTESGWKTVLASTVSKTISVYDFGNDLSMDPVEVTSQVFTSLGNLEKIKVFKQLDKYYAVLSSQGARDVIIDLKSLESADLFEDVGYTTLPDNYGHDIVKDSGRYISVGASFNLNLTKFEQSCEASVSYSEDFEPELIYNTSGEYPIELVAFDKNCKSSTYFDAVGITTSISPSLFIKKDPNLCITAPNTFTSEVSDPVTSYSWDFGDGIGTSSQADTVYQYQNPGSYPVRLDILADNGCENFVIDTVKIYPEPPPVDFSTSIDLLCTGELVELNSNLDQNFVDSVYEGNLQYEWYYNGQVISSAFDTTITVQESGENTFGLKNFITGCETPIEYDTITINESPQALFDSETVCFGETTNFTNQTAEITPQLKWEFGDGFSSNLNNPEHFYENPGAYNASLLITDSNGCRDTLTQMVRVGTQPTVDFSFDNVCSNETTQFTSEIDFENTNIIREEWYVNDTLTLAAANLNRTISDTSTLRFVAYTSENCISEISKEIIPNFPPNPDFQIIANCLGDNQLLINQTPDIQINSWEIDGVEVPGLEDTIQFNTSVPGDYLVKLSVTDTNACSNFVEKTLTVARPPELSVVNESACAEIPARFEDNSLSFDDPVQSRKWFVNDQEIGTSKSILYPFEEAGEYDITLQLTTEQGCTYDTVFSQQVFSRPTAALVASSDFALTGGEIIFNDISENSVNRNWFISGQQVSNEGEFSFQFDKPGNYTVKLVSLNEQGCADTTSTIVLVDDPKMDIILKSVELQSDLNGLYNIVVDVENNSNLPVEQLEFRIKLENQFDLSERYDIRLNQGESEFIVLNSQISQLRNPEYLCVTVSNTYDSVDLVPSDNEDCLNIELNTVIEPAYPNPVSDELSIPVILPEESTIEIKLYNLAGKQKVNYSSENNRAGLNAFLIDVRSIEPGVYFLEVIAGKEKSVERIIIQ